MITPQPTYLFKSSSETVFYIGQGSRNYKISTILLLKQDLSNDNNSWRGNVDKKNCPRPHA